MKRSEKSLSPITVHDESCPKTCPCTSTLDYPDLNPNGITEIDTGSEIIVVDLEGKPAVETVVSTLSENRSSPQAYCYQCLFPKSDEELEELGPFRSRVCKGTTCIPRGSGNVAQMRLRVFGESDQLFSTCSTCHTTREMKHIKVTYANFQTVRTCVVCAGLPDTTPIAPIADAAMEEEDLQLRVSKIFEAREAVEKTLETQQADVKDLRIRSGKTERMVLEQLKIASEEGDSEDEMPAYPTIPRIVAVPASSESEEEEESDSSESVSETSSEEHPPQDEVKVYCHNCLSRQPKSYLVVHLEFHICLSPCKSRGRISPEGVRLFGGQRYAGCELCHYTQLTDDMNEVLDRPPRFRCNSCIRLSHFDSEEEEVKVEPRESSDSNDMPELEKDAEEEEYSSDVEDAVEYQLVYCDICLRLKPREELKVHYNLNPHLKHVCVDTSTCIARGVVTTNGVRMFDGVRFATCRTCEYTQMCGDMQRSVDMKYTCKRCLYLYPESSDSKEVKVEPPAGQRTARMVEEEVYCYSCITEKPRESLGQTLATKILAVGSVCLAGCDPRGAISGNMQVLDGEVFALCKSCLYLRKITDVLAREKLAEGGDILFDCKKCPVTNEKKHPSVLTLIFGGIVEEDIDIAAVVEGRLIHALLQKMMEDEKESPQPPKSPEAPPTEKKLADEVREFRASRNTSMDEEVISTADKWSKDAAEYFKANLWSTVAPSGFSYRDMTFLKAVQERVLNTYGFGVRLIPGRIGAKVEILINPEK